MIVIIEAGVNKPTLKDFPPKITDNQIFTEIVAYLRRTYPFLITARINTIIPEAIQLAANKFRGRRYERIGLLQARHKEAGGKE